ncbi:beta-galactosidase [Thalassobacterium sedimentorum]|nr:beta-galactosidase [Coraliomargarita sp. SDUM461004]
MLNIFKHKNQPLYGADYNPDQWLDRPDILTRDIELMKEAGCTTMTLGVFAWTSYESEDGVYHFEWLDDAMDRLHQAGIGVFLATPTAAKPLWLSEANPEIRRVDRQGVREPSGERHNHCPSSQLFRQKSQAINRELAKRYAGHPALMLWHVNNEISGECFCESCLTEFRVWLQRKYGSLDALNAAWWAAFWNHSVTEWEQITPFDQSVDGMVLDWRRFVNDLHVSTLENEMVPLRELTPEIPCTTNFMSTFDTNNYYQWSKVLDLVSNDRYPLHDDRENSWQVSMRTEFVNALMRGMAKGQSWIQMECSPSSVNWWQVNKLKRPGVHFSEAMQYLAHGADAVHYFQWRKGRGGCEKFHGAVIDHDGSGQTRVFAECCEVGRALESCADISGVPREKSPVAIVYDWESKWAIRASVGPKAPRLEYPKADDVHTQTAREHYNALARMGVNADITFKDQDWSDYRCLILPSLYLIDADTAAKVSSYVEAGGVVVGTYLTAYVDPNNRVWNGGLPGAGLRSVFGVWNEEIDYLFEEESNTAMFNQGSEQDQSIVTDFAELIHAESAHGIAVYNQDFYQNRPVCTKNAFGTGTAFYVGARLDGQGLIRFYRDVLMAAKLKVRAEALPAGVVIQDRKGAAGRVFRFVFNFTRTKQAVELEGEWRDLVNDAHRFGSVELAPYATMTLISESVN